MNAENLKKLDECVERYCNLKNEADSYKKQIDSDNKEIKTLMKEAGLTEHSIGNYCVKYSVSVSRNFDNERLISKLRSLNPVKDGKYADELGLIEYVPTVNMEVLEDLIYNGVIKASDLTDCEIVTETAKLTIKKSKRSE